MDLRICTALALGSLLLASGACTAGGEDIPEVTGGSAGSGSGNTGNTTQGGSAGSVAQTGGSGGSAGSVVNGGSGGSAGSVVNGGTGGTGGSDVSGGTGGSAGSVAGPPDPQFNNGTPYYFSKECVYENDGSPLAECSEGEVCWVAENDTPANPYSEMQTIPMGGDPNVIYNIKVRIRGIIEPKYYTNGCEPQFMRATNPANETRSIYVCKAAATTSWNDTYNVWQLAITDPPQTFYLNADNENPGHRVNTIDGEFTFQARGGTAITMYFDDLNGGQIRNCALSMPDLDVPAGGGNFYQFDVLSWEAAP